MIKKWIAWLAFIATGFVFSVSAVAAGVGNLERANNDLSDRASLQRGAQLFMNYCSGCHSLQYLRYARLAEDLGLTEDEVMENLNFTGGKFGDHIMTSMSIEDGTNWFGKAPPDLTLTSRVRGDDWVYTYLKSFYLDDARPLGWNNTLFDSASMPNVLWELQGIQSADYGDPDPQTGEFPIKGFIMSQSGLQSAEEFNQTVRDITNFLAYAAEPIALKRQALGIWVILFCLLFTFVAYLLKKEYWKDVEH
ncbi:MAG: cytochrome c1 [Xanthomonadaceae bacterium]|jgi:ubiquinol-cytochrome c reductase cytochrome c1 subunit|nr:cytochrome c1 [Xanthomonadaceae bacterium]